MLKRIIAIMILFCLIVSIAGCNQKQESKEISSDHTKTADNPPSEEGQNSDADTGTSTPETETGAEEQIGESTQDAGVSTEKQIVGISRTPLSMALSDEWGLKLTVRNITPTKLNVAFEQQDGKPSGKLLTGSYYSLEKLENGNWTELEPIIPKDQMSFSDEGLPILPDRTTEYPVDWTEFYGELAPGSYRIGKKVMDYRATADYDEKIYYAAFDLILADETTRISYEHDGFGFSLPYVPGFEYAVEEFSDDSLLLGSGQEFAISFRPLNKVGRIIFYYYTSFGVCGTSLEEKDYGEGKMGFFAGNPDWDFIAFPASEGNFVVMNQSQGNWFSIYKDQIMQIIDQTERIDPGK